MKKKMDLKIYKYLIISDLILFYISATSIMCKKKNEYPLVCPNAFQPHRGWAVSFYVGWLIGLKPFSFFAMPTAIKDGAIVFFHTNCPVLQHGKATNTFYTY